MENVIKLHAHFFQKNLNKLDASLYEKHFFFKAYNDLHQEL